jgi:hypothetical protein
MQKENEFTGFLKDKNIATKKETLNSDIKNKNKTSTSLGERFYVSLMKLFSKFKSAFHKSKKFGYFVISGYFILIFSHVIYRWACLRSLYEFTVVSLF